MAEKSGDVNGKGRNLNDFAKDLMYFCLKLKRENNFPVPLINYNVTDNFWEVIQWDERFQGIYSF